MSSVFSSSAVNASNFERQFAGNYFVRLEELRPALRSAAMARFSSDLHICDELTAVKSSTPSDVVVIGTVFKEMKLKPSVLSDLQKQLAIGDYHFMPKNSSFVRPLANNESDRIFLEDLKGRIEILLKEPSVAEEGKWLVTGMVVAMKGALDIDGRFVATEICFPGYPSPVALQSAHAQPRYIAFASGLELNSGQYSTQAVAMFLAFLYGHVNSELASHVTRLVLMGNTIGEVAAPKNEAFLRGIAEADRFVASVSSVIPVDVMPGIGDPTNVSLPQAPLHPCVLPTSYELKNCTCVSNPYKFAVQWDGADSDQQQQESNLPVFWVSSGHNLLDYSQYTSTNLEAKPIEYAVKLVESRVLTPTGPDTLAVCPYKDNDPFILGSDATGAVPHVVLFGNQKNTSVGMVAAENGSPILVGTVASFTAAAPEVLLVDVNNVANYRILSFGPGSGDTPNGESS